MILKDIYAYLKQSAILSAALEAGENDSKIYPNYARMSSKVPYIVYRSTNPGGNIFYAFPSTLTAQVIQITFTPLSGNFYAGSLALCERLMALDKALSSVRPSSYFRGGHHYLASGALIAWKDFSKLSFDISLSNVPQDTAHTLTGMLSNNAFLTYALYGGADAAFCKEFALSAPPVLNIERKTALCQIEFTLLER